MVCMCISGQPSVPSLALLSTYYYPAIILFTSASLLFTPSLINLIDQRRHCPLTFKTCTAWPVHHPHEPCVQSSSLLCTYPATPVYLLSLFLTRLALPLSFQTAVHCILTSCLLLDVAAWPVHHLSHSECASGLSFVCVPPRLLSAVLGRVG